MRLDEGLETLLHGHEPALKFINGAVAHPKQLDVTRAFTRRRTVNGSITSGDLNLLKSWLRSSSATDQMKLTLP